MRNYQQVATLIEQDFDRDTIAMLTDAPIDEINQIAANLELELKMQSKGFERFMARQEGIKESGRAMDSEVTMKRVKELLKPMAKAIDDYAANIGGRGRPSIIVTELRKHDSMTLSLATIRRAIMAITTDKTELTSLAQSLVNDLNSELEVVEQVRIGWKLLSLLCKHCDHHFEIVLKGGSGGHGVNCIQATEEFYAWEDLNESLMAELAVMYRPMVIPPKPWVGLNEGGYWHPKMKQPFIRNNPKANNRTHGVKVIPKVYEAVNKIQATPFAINTFVLDVANELADTDITFNKYYEKLPERPHNERTKELAATIETCEKELGITKDQKVAQGKGFGKWVRDLLERIVDGDRYAIKVKLEEARFKMVQYVKWRKEMTSKKSKNRVISTALEVANEYRNFSSLYFPHNLDWRGRMYPMCAGLTTQGVTLQKALLKFAQGKPLNASGRGEEAAEWLMVHTANTFGMDKKSWQDRICWTMDNRELIERVASDPIKHLDDWKGTDEPWLFLAACEQMCKYYQDGLDAVIDISIPMDGTCNGAQHYAAMARDTKGAYGVNVAPNGTQGLAERLADLRQNRQCRISPTRITHEVNNQMKEIINESSK